MFVPRNIEKRQETLKKIREKETKETNLLVASLTETLRGFKRLKVKDEKEQFFTDKFIDCKLKVNHVFPNTIFFFDQKGEYLSEYDSKNHEFWIRYSTIWSILESKYSLNYDDVKQLTQAWVEEHFKLRPFTTQGKLWSFKPRPITTEPQEPPQR